MTRRMKAAMYAVALLAGQMAAQSAAAQALRDSDGDVISVILIDHIPVDFWHGGPVAGGGPVPGGGVIYFSTGAGGISFTSDAVTQVNGAPVVTVNQTTYGLISEGQGQWLTDKASGRRIAAIKRLEIPANAKGLRLNPTAFQID